MFKFIKFSMCYGSELGCFLSATFVADTDSLKLMHIFEGKKEILAGQS